MHGATIKIMFPSRFIILPKNFPYTLEVLDNDYSKVHNVLHIRTYV